MTVAHGTLASDLPGAAHGLSEQKVKSRSSGGAWRRAGGVVVAVPGDGWRLFHAVARSGPGLEKRAGVCAQTYLQTLD